MFVNLDQVVDTLLVPMPYYNNPGWCNLTKGVKGQHSWTNCFPLGFPQVTELQIIDKLTAPGKVIVYIPTPFF